MSHLSHDHSHTLTHSHEQNRQFNVPLPNYLSTYFYIFKVLVVVVVVVVYCMYYYYSIPDYFWEDPVFIVAVAFIFLFEYFDWLKKLSLIGLIIEGFV